MEKGLNRNQLKYIAIITMIIDHIAWFFIPSSSFAYSFCRFIGKLTAPIMCYFLVEGYKYTSSKTKYLMRLSAFSVISQFAFSLAFFNKLFVFKFNMIFTLLLCFIVLLSYEKIKNKIVKRWIILALIIFSYYCDWGIFAPLWVLSFYTFKENTLKQALSYSINTIIAIIVKYIIIVVYPWNQILIQLGLLLFIPVLYLYNGEKGKSSKFNKWFFYIFYPLHLLLLYFV